MQSVCSLYVSKMSRINSRLLKKKRRDKNYQKLKSLQQTDMTQQGYISQVVQLDREDQWRRGGAGGFKDLAGSWQKLKWIPGTNPHPNVRTNHAAAESFSPLLSCPSFVTHKNNDDRSVLYSARWHFCVQQATLLSRIIILNIHTITCCRHEQKNETVQWGALMTDPRSPFCRLIPLSKHKQDGSRNNLCG